MSNWIFRVCLVWHTCFAWGQEQNLTVQLNDSWTNRPIEGVFFEIPSASASRMSNTEGKVMFNLPEGNYEVRVSHISYGQLDTTLYLSAGQTNVVRLTERSYLFSEVELISTWARDRTPMTFNNYSKEYIQKNNQGQDVPFILQWTPSAVATSDAGAGIGYTGISIRGSDPTRINVTINGVPLNDSESQGVFWVNMPDFASSVDNVQIQRGAGSSTNGAGAFGATINLSTQQVKTRPSASVATTLGSFNTRRVNAIVGTGLMNDKFTLDLRYSKIDSDGYVDRASSDLQSFQISAAWIEDKSSLKFNVFSGKEVTYQAWNGLPYQFRDNPDLRTYNVSGARSDGSFYDNQVDDYTQTHYQLIHQYNPIENLFTNFTLHYTRGFGFFEEFRENDRLNRYKIAPIVIGENTINRSDIIRRRWLDNHFYGGIFSLDYNLNDNRDQLTLGLAYNEYIGDHFGEVIWARFAGASEHRDHYYFNDAKKTDFNSFIKYNRMLGEKWSYFADLQYRRISYVYAGDNNAGWVFDGNADFDFINPKTGIFYRDLNGNEAYASIATAAREPNRRDFTDTAEGNEPRAEFMYNPEFGYKKKSSWYTAGVNFYLMYYRDQLALTGDINDVGAAVRTNIPESYRAGIELEAAAQWKGFFAGGALTVSRNRITEFVEKIDEWDTGGQIEVIHRNTDLAFSPNVIANIEIGYKLNNVSWRQYILNPEISILTKHVGRQFLDNTSNSSAALDAYTFSDLRIRIPMVASKQQTLTFSLWINNLWNAQYITNAWNYRFMSAAYNPIPDDPYARREGGSIYSLTGLFPQAGRNWLAGFQYEF